MIGILDTHAFIWAAETPHLLSPTARAFIVDPRNTILLSVASVWEMIIKHSLGKLPLAKPIDEMLQTLPQEGIDLLPITIDHVMAVMGLPSVHKDPFDRILAAQSIRENAAIVTIDGVFRQYPVRIIW